MIKASNCAKWRNKYNRKIKILYNNCLIINFIVPKEHKLNIIFSKNYTDDNEKEMTWKKIFLNSKIRNKG